MPTDAVIRLLLVAYAPDQLRVPVGRPNVGQWTSGGPAATELISDLFSAFLSDLPTLLLAGGFEKEDMGKTVQEFVAEKCKAEIYEVLPGEYMEQSINDVVKANKRHDRMGQRCYKLLLQRRFRK